MCIVDRAGQAWCGHACLWSQWLGGRGRKICELQASQNHLEKEPCLKNKTKSKKNKDMSDVKRPNLSPMRAVNPLLDEAHGSAIPSLDPTANADSLCRNAQSSCLTPNPEMSWRLLPCGDCSLPRLANLLDSAAYHEPLLPCSVFYNKHTKPPPSESRKPFQFSCMCPMSVISSFPSHIQFGF